ncbi:hypothetical protein [Bacillus horti]|uniref:Uncharacterized protein n=1 Tax=Caldalkalibacillus horti TaxID=77523 RepID=A0ABT9W0L5_9BACI|nr:hypothetical protein [Bacillus horti]MDQ0166767.1 hypothetical protein [Bacillus horti]
MDKKMRLIQLIDSFKQHSFSMPAELSSLFLEIEQKLNHYSLEKVEDKAIHVETQPAQNNLFEAEDLYNLLYRAYPLMNELAKQNSVYQFELLQALNQLRGELGMATDLPIDLQ